MHFLSHARIYLPSIVYIMVIECPTVLANLEGCNTGKKYTIFSDYQLVILRPMSGTLGPGQHWARAIIEVATQLVANNRSGSYRSRHMLGSREMKEQTEWLRRQPKVGCTLSQVRLGGRPASLTSPGGPTKGRARATSQWARDRVHQER